MAAAAAGQTDEISSYTLFHPGYAAKMPGVVKDFDAGCSRPGLYYRQSEDFIIF